MSSQPLSKPMSVREIAEKATAFEFNPFIALKYWLRTAETLLKEVCIGFPVYAEVTNADKHQAQIYDREHNYQQAYLLLMRYATLVVEKLPQHPASKSPENKKALKSVKSTIPEVIAQLEVLKPKIEKRHTVWEAQQRRRKEMVPKSSKQPTQDFAAADPAIAGNTATLSAVDNSDLAVKLAHREIRRRDAARKSTRQAGISEEEEQERRVAGLWDDWERELSKDKVAPPEDGMQARMEDSRRRLDGHDGSSDARKRLSKVDKRPRPLPTTSNDHRYPSVQQPSSFAYDVQIPSSSIFSEFTGPPKPLKEIDNDDTALPARPAKEALASETPSPAPEEPSTHTFKPSAYLENGQPLRTIFLPPTLRDQFLAAAAANTRNNLETCGILCGTLISNALFISKLVIPEQTATSDTCETVNESALFDYCDAEDLMVLGWIHTHPTQTCFMSSRDLHTHCGYQVMMPEAIAIVMAPSKNPSLVTLWQPFPSLSLANISTQMGMFPPHRPTRYAIYFKL